MTPVFGEIEQVPGEISYRLVAVFVIFTVSFTNIERSRLLFSSRPLSLFCSTLTKGQMLSTDSRLVGDGWLRLVDLSLTRLFVGAHPFLAFLTVLSSIVSNRDGKMRQSVILSKTSTAEFSHAGGRKIFFCKPSIGEKLCPEGTH